MANEKAKAQRGHAKRRAYERYGLVLTQHDLNVLVKRIRAGEGFIIERQSLRITVRALEVRGQVCHIVYDSVRGTVVSFLPKTPR